MSRERLSSAMEKSLICVSGMTIAGMVVHTKPSSVRNAYYGDYNPYEIQGT